MPYTIAVILVVLWLCGLVASHTLHGTRDTRSRQAARA